MPLMVNGIQVDINAKNNASPVLKQVAADAGALETQNGNLATSEANASGETAGLMGTVSELGSALTLVTTIAAAFTAAFEFGEIAAGNERLRTSGEHLAEGYNQSLDMIVQKVHDASLGTVSDMDIIASSNKAMMLGVGGNATQLANLMEIAAFRGRAMGLTTSQAFDDMSRGIGRMSPMILDNLGIVVDAESTYSNYAASIGKSSSELTRAEKVQALLNKVLEEGNRQLDDAGGLVEDQATSYERWDASLENLKNNFAETFIGMSYVADIASQNADGLSVLIDVTRELGEESVLKLNLISIATRWWQTETELAKEEQYAAADAVAAHGDALDGVVPKITTMNDAMTAAIEVDGNAVKGAMQVHDTYVTLDGKMKDLQVDHDELLAKKQTLIDQGWWPEGEKIRDVNEKLAENEQKQRDVTTAMQGTLTQMLLNTAAAGLDAEGQLALARATGEIDEATYAALTAQALLKKQYEDGEITAGQYATKTLELKDAVARLESKNITITADAIFNEIRTITTTYSSAYNGNYNGNYWAGGGYADGGISTGPTSGHLELLHGTEAIIPLKDGSIPVQIQSPADMMGGSGISLQVVYSPTIAFGDESEAQNRMWPFLLKAIQTAKANGQI